MKRYVIKKEQFKQLLDQLANKANLYAPVKDKTRANWAKIKSAAQIYLEQVNTREPAKGFIFPACEVLIQFDRSGNAVEPEPREKQIIFGIRPCDARAIAFIERFYTVEGKTDPYVKARRENSTFIGIACNRTAPECFCTAVGGSPHSAAGMDLLLTDLGDVFLAEPVTEKGEGLVGGYPEAEDGHLKAGAKLKEKAEAEISLRIDTAKLKEILPKAFASKIWETLALNCVNCGACTFLCPTCHCFDVSDESVRGRVVRIRVWDSCQFALYSRHASGHNPRFDPAARYRNRVMDKFYYTVEQVGEISCVGCGRCIIACPAGIDIRTTVKRLFNELPEG